MNILSLAVLFALTLDQDKGKVEKTAPIIVMHFGFKNSSTHWVFLEIKLGFTSGFTEAQTIIISEFAIFC